MGFGLPENILYTVMNGAQVGVGRLILTPFFHAATTALVGYFAARAKLAGRPLVSVWWAMLLAIGVHGMYDFGLFSQRPLFMIVSFMIASGLTGVLFVMAAVAKTRDQQYGLSAVGENTFCRTCGQPNAHKFLYCQKCGNRA
jgi:RsiW-degrading membrane proteinase PrsW (M82 family)